MESTARGITEEGISVVAFEHYLKVQEAHPIHMSNLINKELAYDCIIDTKDDGLDSVKLINCTNSARPNSEVYKRFARKLISNMKNGVDQLFFFSSLNTLARLETSIGLVTNPGIFLIVGLAFLDEKYKEYHQRCQVQFSFLECRDSNMYDLLCYTKTPLQPQKDSKSGVFVGFREHWAKATTFNQFIKLFKIALFNNKERDLQYDTQPITCTSTFIMKIRRKLYDEKGELSKQQETVLVDYEPNCVKQSSKEKGSGRSLLDYILIAVNNANPYNRPLHCHLVEEHLLLQMIRKYLPHPHPDRKDSYVTEGHVSFITSFPADKGQFQANHSYVQNIEAHLGEKLKVQVETKFSSSRLYNMGQLESSLMMIAQGMMSNSYSSLKKFHQLKHSIVSQVRKIKQNLREFRKVITGYLKEKVERQFLVNELVSYEYKLVGSCIKSDHFKDFYQAKSYLQLQRQVEIKTGPVKEAIRAKDQKIDQLQKRFICLKKKEPQSYQKIKNRDPVQNLKQIQLGTMTLMNSAQLWSAVRGDNKFKKLTNLFGDEETQKAQLEAAMAELHFYIHRLWQIVSLTDERTVAQTIELEEEIMRQEKKMFEVMSQFTDSVENISESDITYQQENCKMGNKEVSMFRSFNFLGLLGPKKMVNGYEVSKRLMLVSSNRSLPRAIPEKPRHPKLPSIETPKPFLVTGELKLSELLLTPGHLAGSS